MRSQPCAVRAGDRGQFYLGTEGPGDSAGHLGTGEVPDGLEGGYLYSAGSVRTPYVVNRAPQGRQGKATVLVAFAEPSSDRERSASSGQQKKEEMESAYVEMATPLVAVAGRRPMRQCQWRATHKRRSTYMHMASFVLQTGMLYVISKIALLTNGKYKRMPTVMTVMPDCGAIGGWRARG